MKLLAKILALAFAIAAVASYSIYKHRSSQSTETAPTTAQLPSTKSITGVVEIPNFDESLVEEVTFPPFPPTPKDPTMFSTSKSGPIFKPWGTIDMNGETLGKETVQGESISPVVVPSTKLGPIFTIKDTKDIIIPYTESDPPIGPSDFSIPIDF